MLFSIFLKHIVKFTDLQQNLEFAHEISLIALIRCLMNVVVITVAQDGRNAVFTCVQSAVCSP